MDSIFELEREYWELSKYIDLFEFITPINLNQEKKDFLYNFERNRKYIPIFKYKELENANLYLKTLKDFEYRFKQCSDPISFLYLKLLAEDLKWVSNILRRDSNDFKEWLSMLYGRPNKSLYDFALNTLNSLKTEYPEEKKFFSYEMKEVIINKLKENKFRDWTIKIENSPSRISVNPVKKLIIIKDNSYFTLSEINRIIVHEIETHVLRFENGTRQKYLIFSKGFPNYLETEEGLALLSEHKNNLLSVNDLIKYCSRLIVAYQCFELDFWELFLIVNRYLSVSDSFDLVSRIKRGLKDTSDLGGFTKDQIYYSGFLQVSKLKQNELKKLYIGKVGIKDLDFIDELNYINYNIQLPGWLK